MKLEISPKELNVLRKYSKEPNEVQKTRGVEINCFCLANADENDVVRSFSKEWGRFSEFTPEELEIPAQQYFDVLKPGDISEESNVLDVGCGSGRWSVYLSDKVKFIEAIDPSDSIIEAAVHNKGTKNVRWTRALAENIPFNNEEFDLVLCLGVLHHLENPEFGLREMRDKLKYGGKILLYFYYDFENRSFPFKVLFQLSNLVRIIVSKLPMKLKFFVCDLLAVLLYVPFVGLAKLLKKLFPNKQFYKKVPLSYYSDKSWKIIRNDSLDRFGTPFERRYSRDKILSLVNSAGFKNVKFSEKEPFWHLIAEK